MVGHLSFLDLFRFYSSRHATQPGKKKKKEGYNLIIGQSDTICKKLGYSVRYTMVKVNSIITEGNLERKTLELSLYFSTAK